MNTKRKMQKKPQAKSFLKKERRNRKVEKYEETLEAEKEYVLKEEKMRRMLT